MAEKVSTIFSYTGSVEYSFQNVVLNEVNDNAIVTYNKSGYQGINAVPYDGATVTMKADASGAVRDFDPNMNNRMFYLVTDQTYTLDQYDTVLSIATEVYPTLTAGEFVATFVFSNPNDYKNLYLIWDYVNDMDEGRASFTGDDFERYLDVDFGSDIGRAGLYYDIPSVPARIKIQWEGEVVLDTGYVGLNSAANYNALIAAGVDDADISLVEPYDGLVNNGTATETFRSDRWHN
jgi:hypothetical protein